MKTALALALLLLAPSSNALPAISTITPAAGGAAGGEYVHIHGTDLQLVPLPCFPPCPLLVTFGGVEAPVVFDSAEEIVAIAPPHDAGSVDVQVVLATKGTVTVSNGYRYENPLPSDSVRYLAPVVISAPGTLGSKWVSELSITNSSSETLVVGGSQIPPGTTNSVTLPSPNAGAFFTIPKRLAANVTASLRVHDTSRDADSWGTDVPVVPETQFRPSVVIAGIPIDARFRTLLRLYGYTADFLNATVTIRDAASGEMLSTQPAAMQGGSTAPSYAQLALDSILAPFAGAHPRVTAQITAQQIPIWAFVAVTNNTTQQVTTLTPSLTPSTAPLLSLAAGHWAGGGSCVDVKETDVDVTMACAIAHFPRPATLSSGRFEADGTYKITAGPIGPGNGVPAHFSGVVQGNDLSLTIQPSGGTAFTIHVTFGSTQPCPQLCV